MATNLQDISAQAVSLWAKQVNHSLLRDQAWLVVSDRFPGITKGIASYLLEHYADPKERQAAFDGLTLTLLTVSHYQDLEKLTKLFEQPVVDELASSEKSLKAKTD